MLIVDNDDFLLVAPRPLLALRHALGRSLISLQGARRIGPQHSWEALYPIQHKNTLYLLYWVPPLYLRILRMYHTDCILWCSLFMCRIGPQHSCALLGASVGRICIQIQRNSDCIEPHHSTFSILELEYWEALYLDTMVYWAIALYLLQWYALYSYAVLGHTTLSLY